MYWHEYCTLSTEFDSKCVHSAGREGANMRAPLLMGLLIIGGVGLIMAAQFDGLQPGETRNISLSEVYASFSQEEVKSADEAIEAAEFGDMLSILRDAPPRIVLCAGTDIATAVEASK